MRNDCTVVMLSERNEADDEEAIRRRNRSLCERSRSCTATIGVGVDSEMGSPLTASPRRDDVKTERRDGEQLCLAAYIKINGVNTYTLFDSGSTTDPVSPDFYTNSKYCYIQVRETSNSAIRLRGQQVQN